MSDVKARSGARRLAEVDPQLRAQLEAGILSTATHVEHMAIDQASLWAAAFPVLAGDGRRFDGLPFIGRLRLGGRMLFDAYGHAAWSATTGAEPDTVRAWRAFAVAATDLPLPDKLNAIRSFADDEHFAVREWAWLSLRDNVCAEPEIAVGLLADSLAGGSARWRRFASEVTRPRSVWGRHIGQFKEFPWDAERLLVPLLPERERYVFASVTNWLNDVSVSHPGWVRSMCEMATDRGADERGFWRRATRAAAPRHVVTQ